MRCKYFTAQDCNPLSECFLEIQFSSGGIFASFPDMFSVNHLFVNVQQKLNLLHSVSVN